MTQFLTFMGYVIKFFHQSIDSYILFNVILGVIRVVYE